MQLSQLSKLNFIEGVEARFKTERPGPQSQQLTGNKCSVSTIIEEAPEKILVAVSKLKFGKFKNSRNLILET